jgi:hypothetical protein
VSNFCEGGTKFFLDFLKFFLSFLDLFSMQIISLSDLSPEFDKLLHKFGGVQVLALCRVVRSYRVTLGYCFVLGSLALLGARLSLLSTFLLLLSIVVRWSGGAFRSQQSRWWVFVIVAVRGFRVRIAARPDILRNGYNASHFGYRVFQVLTIDTVDRKSKYEVW